jgi:hypothetical protein
MFPILSRCDEHGLPAYLEASSPRNRALYERHGFAVVEEMRLPRGGPALGLSLLGARRPARAAALLDDAGGVAAVLGASLALGLGHRFL